MTYEELDEEQQLTLEPYLIANGIETTIENLNTIANRFDEIVKTTLIVGEVSGIVGGIQTKEFVSYTRNELVNKMLDQALSMAQEFDQNLMKVSYNSKASPLCIHRQNKIYWTIRPEGGYSELDPEIWKRGASGYTGGLFHPNCRHQLYAYFPGESDPVEQNPLSDEEIAKNYKISQDANYIKRTKQKYYRNKQIAKGTNNGSYKHYNELHKKWVQKEKDFKALHNL